jgi:serine/threonine protein kinase
MAFFDSFGDTEVREENSLKRIYRISSLNHTLQTSGGSNSRTSVSPNSLAQQNPKFRGQNISESPLSSWTDHGFLRFVWCFAPEIWGFAERGSAYAIDIWAVGEIVFEILTKKPSLSKTPNFGGKISRSPLYRRGLTMAFFDSFGDTEVREFDPPLVWRV